MGVLQPRARNLLITSNPDMSGKPMSRMTRLQGSESIRNRAVSPSLAQSAACPAALSSAMIPRERAGSSSTSRIRAMGAQTVTNLGARQASARRKIRRCVLLQISADSDVQPDRPHQFDAVALGHHPVAQSKVETQAAVL